MLRPDNTHIWNSRGNAYFNLGNHEKALECYEKALAIDPDNAMARSGKCIILIDKRNFQQAQLYIDLIYNLPLYTNISNNLQGLLDTKLARTINNDTEKLALYKSALTCFEKAYRGRAKKEIKKSIEETKQIIQSLDEKLQPANN